MLAEVDQDEFEARMEDAIASILATGEYERTDGGIRLHVKLTATGEIVTTVTAVKSGEQVE